MWDTLGDLPGLRGALGAETNSETGVKRCKTVRIGLKPGLNPAQRGGLHKDGDILSFTLLITECCP